MTEFEERVADALERIADSLEKLIVTSRTEVDMPPPAGDWTAAAPKRQASHRATYVTFHAIRMTTAGEWITACGAGGTGGAIVLSAMRPLEQVPARITEEATRCGASGCRQVFAQHPERTESS